MVNLGEYMTIAEAAEYLGVSKGRVRQLVSGYKKQDEDVPPRFSAMRIGNTNLVRRSDVMEYANERRNTPKK